MSKAYVFHNDIYDILDTEYNDLVKNIRDYFPDHSPDNLDGYLEGYLAAVDTLKDIKSIEWDVIDRQSTLQMLKKYEFDMAGNKTYSDERFRGLQDAIALLEGWQTEYD